MEQHRGYRIDRIRMARLNHYAAVAAYSMFGIIANLAIILAFGPGANLPARFAMALSVIAVAAAAVLPARSLFKELEASRRDTLDLGEWKGMQIEAYLRDVPITMFSLLTAVFHIAIALVQLWALFSFTPSAG